MISLSLCVSLTHMSIRTSPHLYWVQSFVSFILTTYLQKLNFGQIQLFDEGPERDESVETRAYHPHSIPSGLWFSRLFTLTINVVNERWYFLRIFCNIDLIFASHPVRLIILVKHKLTL